jgi:hypothetical protein
MSQSRSAMGPPRQPDHDPSGTLPTGIRNSREDELACASPPNSNNRASKTSDSAASEIEVLDRLDVPTLQRRWRSLHGRSAPAHLSRSLLIRILAYREQARLHGDVSPGVLRALAAAAEVPSPSGHTSEPAPAGATCDDLRRGTILVREHGGVLHRVTVLKTGYTWNGETFRSLSMVARAITGTRWNGPRFFGVQSIAKAQTVPRSFPS